MKYCNFQSMMILVATNLPNANAARAFGEDNLQAEVCKMADRHALVNVLFKIFIGCGILFFSRLCYLTSTSSASWFHLLLPHFFDRLPEWRRRICSSREMTVGSFKFKAENICTRGFVFPLSRRLAKLKLHLHRMYHPRNLLPCPHQKHQKLMHRLSNPVLSRLLSRLPLTSTLGMVIALMEARINFGHHFSTMMHQDHLILPSVQKHASVLRLKTSHCKDLLLVTHTACVS